MYPSSMYPFFSSSFLTDIFAQREAELASYPFPIQQKTTHPAVGGRNICTSEEVQMLDADIAKIQRTIDVHYPIPQSRYLKAIQKRLNILSERAHLLNQVFSVFLTDNKNLRSVQEKVGAFYNVLNAERMAICAICNSQHQTNALDSQDVTKVLNIPSVSTDKAYQQMLHDPWIAYIKHQYDMYQYTGYAAGILAMLGLIGAVMVAPALGHELGIAVAGVAAAIAITCIVVPVIYLCKRPAFNSEAALDEWQRDMGQDTSAEKPSH